MYRNRQMRRNCSGMVGPSLLKINQNNKKKKQQQTGCCVLELGSESLREKRMLSLAAASPIPLTCPKRSSHPIRSLPACCSLHSFLFFFLVALLPAGVACQRGEQEKRSLSSTRLTKSAFHAVSGSSSSIKAARYN